MIPADDDLAQAFADLDPPPPRAAGLSVALTCAARGWHVFPCGPDKAPLTEHGFKDATADPDGVRALWANCPQASVGVATGASGLVVVDLDCKNGQPGLDEWHKIVAASQEPLEATTLVETPSGGMHVYYRANGHRVTSAAGRLAPGIDTRAEGGYVIAGGSPGYLYVDNHGPECLASLPPGLGEKLAYAKRRNGDEKPAGQIPEGRRDSTLASLAGTMRRRGLSADAIYAALAAENKASCKPPLPDAQVRKIAGSVSRYEPADPVVPAPLIHEAARTYPDDRSAPHIIPVDEGGAPLPDEPPPGPRSYTAPEIVGMESPDPDPVVLYAERGCLFDLVGKSKKGKTTFMLHGCKAVLRSETFVGLPTKRVPILYLTEQTRSSFKDKLETMDMEQESDLHVVFRSDFVSKSWKEVCEFIRGEVARWGIGLIVVDTLSDWAKIADENDNSEALRISAPLREIAEDGVAVTTVRHTGYKQGHDVVDMGRGASAFAGSVDVACVLEGAPGTGHANRRQLRFSSRKDGVPDTLIVELKDGHYEALGAAPNVEYRVAQDFVLEHLSSDAATAVSEKDLLDAGRPQFSRSTLKRVLSTLMRQGEVTGKLGAGSASAKALGYWFVGVDDPEQMEF